MDSLDQICPEKLFLVSSRKSENHYWILHIQITLNTKFQLKIAILYCSTKFDHKRFFWSKAEEVRINFWNLHIQISLNMKFQLQTTILFFETKFVWKQYFCSKTDKWGSLPNRVYSNYSQHQISAWNKSFDFLEQICLKGVFPP